MNQPEEYGELITFELTITARCDDADGIRAELNALLLADYPLTFDSTERPATKEEIDTYKTVYADADEEE